jgi:hypothetical protein
MRFEVLGGRILEMDRHPAFPRIVRARVRVDVSEDLGRYPVTARVRVEIAPDASISETRRLILEKATATVARATAGLGAKEKAPASDETGAAMVGVE